MGDILDSTASNSVPSGSPDPLASTPVLDTLVVPSSASAMPDPVSSTASIPAVAPPEPVPQPVVGSAASAQIQADSVGAGTVPVTEPSVPTPYGTSPMSTSIPPEPVPPPLASPDVLSQSVNTTAPIPEVSVPQDVPGSIPPGGMVGSGDIPPGKSKKRVGGTAIIVGMLLLLIALPVGVYYIAQGQSLNDIRNRASTTTPIYGTPTQPPTNCPSTSDCHCSNGTFKVCNNVLVQSQFGSSCPKWCANPYATAAPTSTWTPNSRPPGVTCYSDNPNDPMFQSNPPQGATVNQAIWGCIENTATGVQNCTWRDACAPHTQAGLPLKNGSSCADMRQLSTGEAYNGAFVGCSAEGYNCFCSGGGHVGDTNLSGTVRCYADYAGDSCGNQNGPGSPNTPGTTNTPGDNETPNPTEPPANTNTPTRTPTQTPTNTPTNTPTITNTPTNTPLITNTPTNTPLITNTPTATPTTSVGCNEACTVNTDCSSGLVCADSRCRNPQCTESSTCQCATNTNTPTPTPTPVAFVGCNSACTVNTDCSSGLVCIDSFCRNPSCTEKTSCQCDVAQVTPQTPIAGTGPSILGASVIAGGFFLLLLGLVF